MWWNKHNSIVKLKTRLSGQMLIHLHADGKKKCQKRRTKKLVKWLPWSRKLCDAMNLITFTVFAIQVFKSPAGYIVNNWIDGNEPS